MSLIDLNNIQRMLDSFYSKIKNNFAPKNHGTHLTLGISSATAFRGDYGNTAYNHSLAPHAPSNAQKNSDITKAEIEAKLTGAITSHNHSSITMNNCSNKDFNTIKTAGWYYGYTGMANAPVQGIGVLEVIVYSPDWLVQRFTVIQESGVKYERHYHSGNTWSTWRTLYDSKNKPTPADIGAAKDSHGTHVTYASSVPLVAGTASTGSANNVSRGDHVHPAQTSVSGNAGTATKLATARKINGTLFDGSADITTANWGTTRNITISDSVGVNTGTAVSVNGSVNVNLKLPATISASLSGNATTATTLATARTINGTSFNGAGNITTANWGTARTITIGGSSKSVNGSANVSWTLAEIGAAKESHGTHVSYGGNGSAATVSRSDHTHKYAGSSSAGGTANSVNGFTFWSGTQSQYDSIATKSSTTVYMITD